MFSLEAVDLFLRSLAVGQLLLLGALFLRWPLGLYRALLLGIGLSTVAYLLLTAPIPDADYGWLRPVLLVLTDAFAYLVWFLAQFAFNDEFRPRDWPRAIKFALWAYALWYVYFLGVLAGQGVFHDVIHLIALILMAHVIYVALKGFDNDLIDSRRRSRILLAIAISTYSILVVALEFMDGRIRNDALFSLLNSGFLCLTILLLSRVYLRLETVDSSTDTAFTAVAEDDAAKTGIQPPAGTMIAQEFVGLKQRLDEFVDAKRYYQYGLSISALARQLDCPEHHLRRLINKGLGFRNFNAFLNSLRIRDAAEVLADPGQRSKPILTVALELGYGSIGPFNRAFKASIGQTPGEYRSVVQNRR
ncbi:MAG: AraC family transcriptional regulator [Pseudomonadales bacterium]|nr:AraC family transcriptional regulator [Pseudomonadales bacterium]